MKPESQRIAIATFMGAKCWYRHTTIGPELVVEVIGEAAKTAFWQKYRVRNPEEAMGTHYLPDFLNDVHDMIAATDMLNPDLMAGGLRGRYLSFLRSLVGDSRGHPDFAMVNAPAAERAEALLRALGLWRDDE